MSQDCILTPIALIRTEFPAKFGIPRQAGLAEELRGKIVFEPAYRVDEALRGLEGFSHIWLIWGFSENRDRGWTPTVRPPRLGGNTRLCVAANLTCEDQFICTRTVAQWKASPVTVGKRPCVFLILA